MKNQECFPLEYMTKIQLEVWGNSLKWKIREDNGRYWNKMTFIGVYLMVLNCLYEKIYLFLRCILILIKQICTMEVIFAVKTYGWQELAIQYAPELTPNSASKRLTRWVLLNKELYERLIALGWKKGLRILTPVQVEAIIGVFGEP